MMLKNIDFSHHGLFCKFYSNEYIDYKEYNEIHLENWSSCLLIEAKNLDIVYNLRHILKCQGKYFWDNKD